MTEASALRLPATHRTPIASHRRELAAATVGAIVESFDWSVYVVFAVYFATDLFGGDSLGSMLVAYGGFTVGFLARPIGGVLLGRLSDSRGRKFSLLVSMSLVSAASLAFALLPGSASIGVWAAVLAVAIRVVQGMAYGGEGPAVAAYVAETAPPRHRYLFSAISYGGIMFGSLLAFGTVAVLNATIGSDAIYHGGWRWAFVAGGLLGLLALWVRSFAPESEELLAANRAEPQRRPSILAILNDHRWAVLTVFLSTFGMTIGYYFALVYLPKYAAALGIANATTASSEMTPVLALVLIAMPFAGVLADRAGLLRVMRITYAIAAVCLLPIVFAMVHRVLPFDIAAVLLGLLMVTGMSVGHVFCAMLMPVEVRAVGTGIVTATTIAVFGGTFPMLAEWLIGIGLSAVIPFYVAGAVLAAFACTFTVMKVDMFTAARKKENTDVGSR